MVQEDADVLEKSQCVDYKRKFTLSRLKTSNLYKSRNRHRTDTRTILIEANSSTQ